MEHFLIQIDCLANKLQAAAFVYISEIQTQTMYLAFDKGPHDPQADILLTEQSPQAQDRIV